MNKLIFVHVENFLEFEPISLNLSNNFLCELVNKKLFIHPRKDYFRGVLGQSVSDINVIAGENGVGKTQLLKLLAELASGAVTLDYLADYRFLMVHQSDETTLVLSSNITVEYQEEPLPGITMIEKNGVVSPIIYYSPFLDFNPLDIRAKTRREPIIDISLSYFVMEDSEQSQKKMDIVPTILTLKANNILRQVDFIAHKPLEVEVPFSLPNSLQIKFNRLTINDDDVSIDDRSVFESLNSYSAEFFREAGDNGISQSEMAKIMFYRNLLSLYFLSVNNNKSQSILHHRFGDGLLSEIEAYEGGDPYALIELFLRFFKAENIFMNPIFERLANIAFSLIDAENTSIEFGSNNNHLTLTVSAGDQRINRLLKELFDPEANSTNKYIGNEILHFISFEWRNLSSGEKSFLDLFARLFLAKKRLTDPSKTILLLLDEAEVGFHPEWQKRFMSYIIHFLNTVFKGSSLQVIIATHSPLVLSDFASERVHLFKRFGERIIKAPAFGTFAQNISELLANDFFIDTILIGNISKQYIDDILETMNDKKTIDGEAFEDLISRIGKIDEPVIKKLLMQTLEEKVNAGN